MVEEEEGGGMTFKAIICSAIHGQQERKNAEQV
jgi:hypothetical protein